MTEFDAKAHVAHMEAVMGLVLAPEWRDTVVAHVATTARMAAVVADFPLPDEVEPAAVFEAGR